MTLMRINRFPFFRDFDSLFRDMGLPVTDSDATERALVPAADIIDHEKSVEIRLDMPGVSPEAIDIKLDGDLLTVSAERKVETKTEGKGWIRQERSWGTFARSFTLPNTIDGGKPEATYKHGVLSVTLPKKEEILPKSFKVKVEA
jgi:HSP20 family protein